MRYLFHIKEDHTKKEKITLKDAFVAFYCIFKYKFFD